MKRRGLLLLFAALALAFGGVSMLAAQDAPNICPAAQLDVTARGEWSAGAAMPTARAEIASAAADGRIYVVGGMVLDGISSAFEVYDVGSDSWQTLPPVPVPVHHPGVVALNGKVYVAGGYNDGTFTPDSRVWVYDVFSQQWAQLGNLPQPHAAGALVAVDTRLYLVGGVPTGTTNWAYDPGTDSWDTSPAPMPTPREHLGAAAIDGRIYAVGGRWGNGGNLGTLEVYDPLSNSWTSLPSMPTPRGGISAAALNGRLYVAGGEDFNSGGCTWNRAEVYEPVAGTWARLPDMPHARHGIASSGQNGRWFIFGGNTTAGGVTPATISAAVDAFTPADGEPPSRG